MQKCPYCGQPLSAVRSDWTTAQPHRFAAGAISIQPGVTYVRREPARPASVQSDVVVPTLQAIGSGIIAGIAGGTVASVAAWPNAGVIGLATGALCSGVVWAALISDHHRLLWRIEEIVGADLDNDGNVGAPPPAPVKAPAVWIKTSPTRHIKATVPWADWAEGNLVAVAVLVRGVQFTRRALIEARAFPNDPEHYSEIYNAMRDADLLSERGELTPAGRAYLAQFLPPPMRRKIEEVAK